MYTYVFVYVSVCVCVSASVFACVCACVSNICMHGWMDGWNRVACYPERSKKLTPWESLDLGGPVGACFLKQFRVRRESP